MGLEILTLSLYVHDLAKVARFVMQLSEVDDKGCQIGFTLG